MTSRIVFKPEYQKVADEFWFTFRDRGCTCFISPPCSYCTHEGNPANLEEDPDAWEDELVAEIRFVAEQPALAPENKCVKL